MLSVNHQSMDYITNIQSILLWSVSLCITNAAPFVSSSISRERYVSRMHQPVVVLFFYDSYGEKGAGGCRLELKTDGGAYFLL